MSMKNNWRKDQKIKNKKIMWRIERKKESLELNENKMIGNWSK